MPSATRAVSPTARARLKDMLGFIEMMERWYAQMLAVPKPQIATAIRLGAKVLNFLPAARKKASARARRSVRHDDRRSPRSRPRFTPPGASLNSAICGSAR